MLRLPDIWDIIRRNLSSEKWTSLEEIYRIVEHNANLDDEDCEPQAPGSDIPKVEAKCPKCSAI